MTDKPWISQDARDFSSHDEETYSVTFVENCHRRSQSISFFGFQGLIRCFCVVDPGFDPESWCQSSNICLLVGVCLRVLIVHHSGLIHIYFSLRFDANSVTAFLNKSHVATNGKLSFDLWNGMVRNVVHIANACRNLPWAPHSVPYPVHDTVQFFRRPTKREQKQLASSMLDSCVDDPSLFWLHFILFTLLLILCWSWHLSGVS